MMPPNILLMSNFESSYLINLISVVESVGSVSSGEEKLYIELTGGEQ